MYTSDSEGTVEFLRTLEWNWTVGEQMLLAGGGVLVGLLVWFAVRLRRASRDAQIIKGMLRAAPALPSMTATSPEAVTRHQAGCIDEAAMAEAGTFGESTTGESSAAPGANGIADVNGPTAKSPSASAGPEGCVPLEM